MTNKLISEVLGTVALIAPSSQAVGAVATPTLTMGPYRKLLLAVLAGALGGAGTVDFKVQASPDGANWTDIPNTAIATINAAAVTAGFPGVAQIEVRADRFNALAMGQYIRGVVTVGGNAVPTAVLALGGDVRYMLGSDLNLAGMPVAVLI